MSTQYVQHVSGQGEKWKVVKRDGPVWYVDLNHESRLLTAATHWLRLPDSEYKECDPPAQWVDVSHESQVHCANLIMHERRTIDGYGPYRLRKVQLYEQKDQAGWAPGYPGSAQFPTSYKLVWAFIVERRTP